MTICNNPARSKQQLSMFLQNITKLLLDYVVSQVRTQYSQGSITSWIYYCYNSIISFHNYDETTANYHLIIIQNIGDLK
jgi:hypothetical protein